MKKQTTKIEPKTKATPRERLIDNVTTTNFDMVLRMCGHEFSKTLVDRIIDIVQLLEDKGDDVSIKDVLQLQDEWNHIPF